MRFPRAILPVVLLLPGLVAEARIEYGPISGAVTPTSAEIRAAVTPGDGPWSVVARPVGGVAGGVVTSGGRPSREGGGIVVFTLSGLSPDTEYEYALVEGGGAAGLAATGRLRTFPAGPAGFTFAYGSCAATGSNHPVFAAIRATGPLFFMNVGDLHYEDIGVDDPDVFREAYRRVFTAERQAALLRETSLVYVWDDHDFGPNNSDATSPSRTSARLTYREVVPHHPMAFGDGDRPITRAFTVGRARFVLTDLRSERSPSAEPDTAHKTMLGTHQKEWFKRELLSAHRSHAVVFWVSSVGWIAKAERGPDNWGAYDTERRELAAFFAEHGIRNLVILSGDAHMLAADDGRNANFAGPGAVGPLAVFHAASLDRRGSYKGGPYSHGAYLPGIEEGCFGLVTVEDDGERVTVRFSGRTHLQQEKVGLVVEVPTG